jgi:hypothetical protein
LRKSRPAPRELTLPEEVPGKSSPSLWDFYSSLGESANERKRGPASDRSRPGAPQSLRLSFFFFFFTSLQLGLIISQRSDTLLNANRLRTTL